jgi:hypothetical protein
MKIKILNLLVGLFLLSFISAVSAGWDRKPEFRFNQLYRFDLRKHDHQLYTNRISAGFFYRDTQEKALFKLEPFFEARRNIHKSLWERELLGIEIGKDIFPWVYLGEAIQQTWIKEDYRYHAIFESKNHAESVTRLLFNHNLLPDRYIKLKGFVLEEYTLDFQRGAGICNEVAIGVIAPITKYVEATINWRHIDRIHYYDSDTFEASVTLVF